ncbi:hypothetical protein CCACVL1_11386 [Corchorus capsularis]|uniref:Uncharacterized protein n=1 Tax=Corchorus capsularis TaxID=210143 RepID=A0A1R3ILP0_COCAP|nr:hypothetical protein CCACVL1_11386 [Corchorus capsularis]
MLGEAQALAANNDMLRRGFISSSDQGFSSVYKAREETPDQQMNTTNDDYTGLLNVVPSSMAIPEWYSDSGEGSNGQSSIITDDNLGLEMHHIANSLLPVDIGATGHGKTSSSRSWDNLHGIC